MWLFKKDWIDNEYRGFIFDLDFGIIAYADNIHEDFINKIIEAHNDLIKEEYKKGIDDGVNICKEIK